MSLAPYCLLPFCTAHHMKLSQPAAYSYTSSRKAETETPNPGITIYNSVPGMLLGNEINNRNSLVHGGNIVRCFVCWILGYIEYSCSMRGFSVLHGRIWSVHCALYRDHLLCSTQYDGSEEYFPYVVLNGKWTPCPPFIPNSLSLFFLYSFAATWTLSSQFMWDGRGGRDVFPISPSQVSVHMEVTSQIVKKYTFYIIFTSSLINPY